MTKKVKTLIDLVFRDYVRNGRSTETLKYVARHVRPVFDDREAESVRKSDLSSYIDLRQTEGAKNATINRELALIRRAYRLGLEEELVDRVPVIKLLQENNVRTGFAEHDEFEKVKPLLEPVYRRPYIFAYYFGRRRGEILKYLKSDVDVSLRILRVRGEIAKNKKGGALPLTGEAWEAVKEAYDRSPGPYLFSRDGEQIPETTFFVHMKMAFAQAGFPKRRFHDLRRTASRNAIRAGNHQKLAQQITGHVSTSTFNRYDIIDERDIIEATTRVDAYINNHHRSDEVERIEAIKNTIDSSSQTEEKSVKSTESGLWTRLKKLLKGE